MNKTIKKIFEKLYYSKLSLFVYTIKIFYLLSRIVNNNLYLKKSVNLFQLTIYLKLW